MTQENQAHNPQVDLPPKRKPWFFDSATGREYTYPDTSDEMAATIANFAFEAEHWPDWRIEGGPFSRLAIKLKVIEHSYGGRAVITASTGSGDAIIRAEPHSSGWIRVNVDWQGRRVFTAWIDHEYEQYALWPSGADPSKGDEEPGRISKKHSWVGLDTSVWPVLAPLADEYEAVTFCERDQEFVYVRTRKDE